MSALPVIRQQASAPGRRKSAEIVRIPAPERMIEDREAAEIVARVIWAAFPGPSAHAVATAAAPALGCSPDTIERMLCRHTRHASARIFLRACAFCLARGVDPLEVAGVADLYRAFQQHREDRA